MQTINRNFLRSRPVVWVLYAGLMVIALALMVFTALPRTALAKGPQSVAELADGLQESVVNISTTQTIKSSRKVPLPKIPKGSPFEEFFKDFFDRQHRPDQPRKVSSLGSGFVLDPSGIIVTNYHVISSADEIIAKFNDGTKLKVVKVIGGDSKTDLALLKVEPEKPLTAVRFGNSSKMRVGDWVMAIGNPFGLGGTVTVGIVSAKNRDINAGPYDEFIQTDAAINRGNSGGPLFDMNGDVIGVNTAIISPTGGSIGIGFAIPSNTAMRVIDQLQRFGEVRRGWLGVRIQTVSEEIAESLSMAKPSGALVANVTPNSPAAKAGIEAGDVILTFDGIPVETMRVLPKLVARTGIDQEVELEILRRGEHQTIKVTIAQLTEETEKKTQSDSAGPDTESEPELETQKLLGMTMAEMSDELRSRYKISEKINGVVVTEVAPESVAARKALKAGDVIVEVTQEEVFTPSDVAQRIATIQKSGRKTVLLLVSDPKGELRFVAVPIDNEE